MPHLSGLCWAFNVTEGTGQTGSHHMTPVTTHRQKVLFVYLDGPPMFYI